MGKRAYPNLARLREILRRQDPPAWSPDYEPAIKAVREEAPPRSRPAQVLSAKLNRYCHVLSSVELSVLFIALCHPDLIELHEQRMLSMEPCLHPLSGHPLSIGLDLPRLEGTISVAQRLDYLNLHPKVYLSDPKTNSKTPVPFPWTGDFLLFLVDKNGPYCLNWTVKGVSEDFNRSFGNGHPIKNQKQDAANVRARHAIEELYYLDAGIRTIRIVERDLPVNLIRNLRTLVLLHERPVDLPAEVRIELIERLRASVQTGRPPLEILLSLRHRFYIDLYSLKVAFYQAIWTRELRVDLFSNPIFISCPLMPEKKDVLVRFAHWFSREVI